jgi:hypothetical protein
MLEGLAMDVGKKLQDKMISRLLRWPILLMAVSAIISVFLQDWQPLGTNPVIAPLGQVIAFLVYAGSFGMGLFAVGWFARNTWRLWRWVQGTSSEQCCHVCGGMVDLKDGRYGLYYKCLACGNTRSA